MCVCAYILKSDSGFLRKHLHSVWVASDKSEERIEINIQSNQLLCFFFFFLLNGSVEGVFPAVWNLKLLERPQRLIAKRGYYEREKASKASLQKQI